MFFGPIGDKLGARLTFGYCLLAAGFSMVFEMNIKRFQKYLFKYEMILVDFWKLEQLWGAVIFIIFKRSISS
jgi:hypothetical protein